jgi:hypothetical protein
LFDKRKTIIEDDVWLVGSCVVSSGLNLGKRSISLINSVITKDTMPNRVYAGNPAKLMENLSFYVPKSLDEKFEMLQNWLTDFIKINSIYTINYNEYDLILINTENNEEVLFTKNTIKNHSESKSIFYLVDKTFNKTNSISERTIYKFLYNNKARFLPS